MNAGQLFKASYLHALLQLLELKVVKIMVVMRTDHYHFMSMKVCTLLKCPTQHFLTVQQLEELAGLVETNSTYLNCKTHECLSGKALKPRHYIEGNIEP